MKLFSIIATKKFWIHSFLASLTGIAMLYGGFLLLDNFTLHGEEVEVPDFKGIYINDLDKFVQGYSLNYEIVDSVYSKTSAKGTVIEQDPASGSKVKNDRVIYLTVNAIFAKKVKMPNLIDLSLKQATSLLETYGLKIGMLRYEEGLPPVMEQYYQGKPVSPGEMIDEGSKIDLLLGRGIGNGLIEVPNLIGFSLEQARKSLAAKRLVLGTVSGDGTEVDTSLARIWKQSPIPSDSSDLYDGAFVNVFITENEELLNGNGENGNEE